MKLTRRIRNCSCRPTLPRQLLLVALAAAIAVQTCTTAFSQEEVPPSTSAAQTPSPGEARKAQVLQIPEGTFVEVELTDGGVMRGKLGVLIDDGFMLQTISHNRLLKRHVRFEEVRSIRPVDHPTTRGQAFDQKIDRTRKIMGIVAGAVSIGILIALVARAR